MTVAELVVQLQKFPPGVRVMAPYFHVGCGGSAGAAGTPVCLQRAAIYERRGLACFPDFSER
jgi:hypothetical protein